MTVVAIVRRLSTSDLVCNSTNDIVFSDVGILSVLFVY